MDTRGSNGRGKPDPIVCPPLVKTLGLPCFRQRFPWVGPDLQTLRDTLHGPAPLPETGETLWFELPEGDRLIAKLNIPCAESPLGLVVIVHGLGGECDAQGPRRLARALGSRGLAVLRLNLRGAGAGRALAKGTYAASCTPDLLPVFADCRRLAATWASPRRDLPLAAVGISLGGTVLLNALLTHDGGGAPLLDALACISSPLDLTHCTKHFEQPRNRLYERWLVAKLIAQTLADSQGLLERERQALTGMNRPKTIRAFDTLITAPRWGFDDVASYYRTCSPLHPLCQRLRTALTAEDLQLPPLLLLHSRDDPWVPVRSTLHLAREVEAWVAERGEPQTGHPPEVVITETGGHNGFHAPGDTDQGCWSDRLVAQWLAQVVTKQGGGE
jgi:predicted alpha/beta-fold hydrolase